MFHKILNFLKSNHKNDLLNLLKHKNNKSYSPLNILENYLVLIE